MGVVLCDCVVVRGGGRRKGLPRIVLESLSLPKRSRGHVTKPLRCAAPPTPTLDSHHPLRRTTQRARIRHLISPHIQHQHHSKVLLARQYLRASEPVCRPHLAPVSDRSALSADSRFASACLLACWRRCCHRVNCPAAYLLSRGEDRVLGRALEALAVPCLLADAIAVPACRETVCNQS